MSLEENLKNLSNSIKTEESQLLLQQILTEEQNFSDLQTPKAHEILKEISSRLKKSLLESKIYHMINSEFSSMTSENNFSTNKSILDLKGNFIWSDKSFEKFFKVPFGDLKSVSLFSLISPNCLRSLCTKFSNELLGKSNKIVISYILTNGIELTSRCTKVVYSNEPGCYKYGVFVQTRFCKHKIQYFGHGWMLSPMYTNDNPLFTPLQITPSILNQSNELSLIDLENLKITPFLKAESPYKKRKVEEWFVSEF